MSAAAAKPAELRVEDWRPSRDASSIEPDLDALAELPHAVVHDGAGVSFVVPFSLAEARAFWTDDVLPELAAGRRRELVARHDGPTNGGRERRRRDPQLGCPRGDDRLLR